MISLHLEGVSSLNRLRRRLEEAPRIVREEMARGMERAEDVLREEVLSRTPVRSGELRDSWFFRVEGGGQLITATYGFTAPHALFVEKPTRPHLIRTKPPGRPARSGKGKGALRWLGAGGRPVFREEVRHPGTSGVFMLRDGTEAARLTIRRRFSARLGNVTKRIARG
jgi:hypothetical protein